MLDWYLKVVRDNYANFNGRARRSEFWYFALVNIIIGFVLGIIDYVIGISILGSIYSLAVIVPSVAVAVRRLHDIGKSWVFILLAFIPIIGWIWLLVLYCQEGNHGPNEYGPDPKTGGYNEFTDIGKPSAF